MDSPARAAVVTESNHRTMYGRYLYHRYAQESASPHKLKQMSWMSSHSLCCNVKIGNRVKDEPFPKAIIMSYG
eukprot:jgi/Psemu1/309022/fgenesh1_kg.467_\